MSEAEFAEIVRQDFEASYRDEREVLEDRLALEWATFDDAMGRPMSLTLGESLRDQLAAVFDILREAGLQIQ